MRKHIIQYDDVMNRKRDVIYRRRRAALIKGAVSEGKTVPFAKEYGVDPDEGMYREVNEVMEDFVKEIIFNACSNSRSPENWDWEYIDKNLMKTMLIKFDQDISAINTAEDLYDKLLQLAVDKFTHKRSVIGERMMDILSRIAIVRIIDINWQEHLREDDDLRSGISLMAHAQKDPLIEYKRKSFESFKEMLFRMNQQTLEFIFKARIDIEISQEEENRRKEQERLNSLKALAQGAAAKQRTVKNMNERVGRNDPCPCGSGKKFKNCHGAE